MSSSMVKITIDGKEHECDSSLTVLQACEEVGIEIPRFCYHDRLSIAGNCRMCLVDVSPGPAKPQASCALPIASGMNITTASPSVRKARKGVMEFLLINHPLDCPICDQGGECDLQDLALSYGFDRGRFIENKRAVSEKYMGPLIKTIMTRCIHCTRCVRFANEVAGIDSIGMVGRGESVEITSLEKTIDSELSGNVIDLCPVGALTSKPYAYRARSWELEKTDSIDVMDAVGSNIRVDSKNGKVMRILPRLHEDVNEEWISDKARFSCDGLACQRLDRPYVRDEKKELVAVDWQEALSRTATSILEAKNRIVGLAGDHSDLESMYALKKMLLALGIDGFDTRQGGACYDPGFRHGYLFNTGIGNVSRADALLIVGCNPREDAPVVNARIRQGWLQGNLRSAYGIGVACDVSYPCNWISDSSSALLEIASGKDRLGVFATLNAAERPMLLLGYDALERKDGKEIWKLCGKLAEKSGMIGEDWNGFNMLHRTASAVGACEIGFNRRENGINPLLVSMAKGEVDVAIVMGADEFDLDSLEKCFTVYIGHHGDRVAQVADVILPSAAYTEKSGMWVNLEGRVQMGFAAVAPPGEARADWRILRALSEHLNVVPSWNSLQELRVALWKEHPDLRELDGVLQADWHSLGDVVSRKEGLHATPIVSRCKNYYMSDPISRASSTMAECTRARRELREKDKAA